MKFLISLVLLLISGPLVANTIILKGSSTIHPLAQKMAKEYARQYNRKVIVKGGGSNFGIKFAVEGKGIGMASKDVSNKHLGVLDIHPFALDAIVIVVNNRAAIENISKNDLKRILNGELTNWLQLGGKDRPIKVFGPNDDHGTHNVMLEYLGLNEIDALLYSAFFAHKKTFAALMKDEDAIGWAPYGQYLKFVEKDKLFSVKLVKLDGARPSKRAVVNKSYPLVRKLSFIRNKQKGGVSQKKFIDFVKSSPISRTLIEQFGFVPLD